MIFSSPRLKAKETAEILAKTLGCRIKMISNIRERNFYGLLTGMKKSDAKRKYPSEVKLLDSYKNTIKGAEGYTEFRARILDVLRQIAKSRYETAAIVTHGGPISCIFREVLELGEFERIGDCAYFEIEKKGNKLNMTRMHNAVLEK